MPGKLWDVFRWHSTPALIRLLLSSKCVLWGATTVKVLGTADLNYITELAGVLSMYARGSNATQDLSTVAGMSSVSGTIDIQTQAICLLLIQQIKTRLLLLSTVLYKGYVTKQSRQTKITCKSTRQTTGKPIISPQRHNVYNWESKRVKSSFSPLPVTNEGVIWYVIILRCGMGMSQSFFCVCVCSTVLCSDWYKLIGNNMSALTDLSFDD